MPTASQRRQARRTPAVETTDTLAAASSSPGMPRPTGSLPASLGQRSLQLGVRHRGNGGAVPRVSGTSGRVVLSSGAHAFRSSGSKPQRTAAESSSDGSRDTSNRDSSSDGIDMPEAAYTLEHRADAVVERLTNARVVATPTAATSPWDADPRGPHDDSIVGADGSHVPGLTAVERDIDDVLSRLDRQAPRIAQLKSAAVVPDEQQRGPPRAQGPESGARRAAPEDNVPAGTAKTLTPMVSGAELAHLLQFSIANPGMKDRLRAQAKRQAAAERDAKAAALAGARSSEGRQPFTRASTMPTTGPRRTDGAPQAPPRESTDEAAIADTVRRQVRDALQVAPVPEPLRRELASQAELLQRIEARQREQQEAFAAAASATTTPGSVPSEGAMNRGRQPPLRQPVELTPAATAKIDAMRRAVDHVVNVSNTLLASDKKQQQAAEDASHKQRSKTPEPSRRDVTAAASQASRRSRSATEGVKKLHVRFASDGSEAQRSTASVQADLVDVAIPVRVRASTNEFGAQVDRAETQPQAEGPRTTAAAQTTAADPAPDHDQQRADGERPTGKQPKATGSSRGTATASTRRAGTAAGTATARPRTTSQTRASTATVRAAAIAAAYRAPHPGSRRAPRRSERSPDAVPDRRADESTTAADVAHSPKKGSGNVAAASPKRRAAQEPASHEAPPEAPDAPSPETDEAVAASMAFLSSIDGPTAVGADRHQRVAGVQPVGAAVMVMGAGTPLRWSGAAADGNDDSKETGAPATRPSVVINTTGGVGAEQQDGDSEFVEDPRLAAEQRILRDLEGLCVARWVTSQLVSEQQSPTLLPGSAPDSGELVPADGVAEAAVRDFLTARLAGESRDDLAELGRELRQRDDERRNAAAALSDLAATDTDGDGEVLDILRALVMSHGLPTDATANRNAADDEDVSKEDLNAAAPAAAATEGKQPTAVRDSATSPIPAATGLPPRSPSAISAEKSPVDRDAPPSHGSSRAATPLAAGSEATADASVASSSAAGPHVVVDRKKRVTGKVKKPLSAEAPQGAGHVQLQKAIDASTSRGAESSLAAAEVPAGAPGSAAPAPTDKPSSDPRVEVSEPAVARPSFTSMERTDRAEERRRDLMTEAPRVAHGHTDDAGALVDVIELPTPEGGAQQTGFRIRQPKVLPSELRDAAVETVVMSDSASSSSRSSSSSSRSSSSTTTSTSSSSTTTTSSSSSSSSYYRRRRRSRSRSRSRRARRQQNESAGVVTAAAEAAVAKFVERVCTSPVWTHAFGIPTRAPAGSAATGTAGQEPAAAAAVSAVTSATAGAPAQQTPAANATVAQPPATATADGAATAAAPAAQAVADTEATRVAKAAYLQSSPNDDLGGIPLVPPAPAGGHAVPAPRMNAWLTEVGDVHRQWREADAASARPDPGVASAPAQARIDRDNAVAPGISEPPSATTSDTHASSFDMVHGTHRFAWPTTAGPQRRMPAHFRRALAAPVDGTVTSDTCTSLDPPSTSDADTSADERPAGPRGATDISSVTSRATTSGGDTSGSIGARVPKHVVAAARAHAGSHGASEPPPIGYAPRRNPFLFAPEVPSSEAVDASFAAWSHSRFAYDSKPPQAAAPPPPARNTSDGVWPPPWRPPVPGPSSPTANET